MRLLRDRLERRVVNQSELAILCLKDKERTRFQAWSVQKGGNSWEANEESFRRKKLARSRVKCLI